MKDETAIYIAAGCLTLIVFLIFAGIALLLNLIIKNIGISLVIALPVILLLLNFLCKIADKRNERKYKKNLL